MDRLLAETDQKMDEPESATRRNAFSHLRAAVAAKKADVAMGARAHPLRIARYYAAVCFCARWCRCRWKFYRAWSGRIWSDVWIAVWQADRN